MLAGLTRLAHVRSSVWQGITGLVKDCRALVEIGRRVENFAVVCVVGWGTNEWVCGCPHRTRYLRMKARVHTGIRMRHAARGILPTIHITALWTECRISLGALRRIAIVEGVALSPARNPIVIPGRANKVTLAALRAMATATATMRAGRVALVVDCALKGNRIRKCSDQIRRGLHTG